jgi:hypothetical protein
MFLDTLIDTFESHVSAQKRRLRSDKLLLLLQFPRMGRESPKQPLASHNEQD